MLSDILQGLLSSVWTVVLGLFFFMASILVHELGHYWTARWRGMKVERFSIGFGPKIFSWRGKDNIEYRLSWIPLGGYVALPQMADMSAIEGESTADLAKLPEPDYTSKMIVFSAGAAMNIVFAFALACIIWRAGQPIAGQMASTTIGYIAPTIELSDNTTVPSPALTAGLHVGDIIRRIDGIEIQDWYELKQTIYTGSDTGGDGHPRSLFLVEREGQLIQLVVSPLVAGTDKDRRVGIAPAYDIFVGTVKSGSIGDKAGVRAGDQLLTIEGRRILEESTYAEALKAYAKSGMLLTLRRGAETVAVVLPPIGDAKDGHGIEFQVPTQMTHPSPFRQIRDQVFMSYRTLIGLLSPGSSIGLDKVSGPVGILSVFHLAAENGILSVISLAILVNVSLAIFNLLPIPVLDGGHMLFATIGKLRGKALPIRFIMTTQSVFMVLLLSMIAYVSVFDVKRLVHMNQDRKAPQEQPQPAEAKPAK